MAKREYMAYLLRLWREKRNGSWRATLENPNNGERAGFATLSELVTFLESKTGEMIQVQVDLPKIKEVDTPGKPNNQ
jgi:hypothetical protein